MHSPITRLSVRGMRMFAVVPFVSLSLHNSLYTHGDKLTVIIDVSITPIFLPACFFFVCDLLLLLESPLHEEITR